MSVSLLYVKHFITVFNKSRFGVRGRTDGAEGIFSPGEPFYAGLSWWTLHTCQNTSPIQHRHRVLTLTLDFR